MTDAQHLHESRGANIAQKMSIFERVVPGSHSDPDLQQFFEMTVSPSTTDTSRVTMAGLDSSRDAGMETIKQQKKRPSRCKVALVDRRAVFAMVRQRSPVAFSSFWCSRKIRRKNEL
jgi:hypothetical protein